MDIQYPLKAIDYSGDDYYQAAQLRYELFYKVHNISFDAIFDSSEATDQHFAIVAPSTNQVLAYGRLGQNKPHEFQIYQMVVRPDCQGQGLGKQLLDGLTDAAIRQGAMRIVLLARVTKQGFYQRSGFEPVGEVFPSAMTGVPHITMQKTVGLPLSGDNS
ncbi:MAG: GNAT family N-acetyltransferase [Cyanobacteria bacterium J06627_8]